MWLLLSKKFAGAPRHPCRVPRTRKNQGNAGNDRLSLGRSGSLSRLNDGDTLLGNLVSQDGSLSGLIGNLSGILVSHQAANGSLGRGALILVELIEYGIVGSTVGLNAGEGEEEAGLVDPVENTVIVLLNVAGGTAYAIHRSDGTVEVVKLLLISLKEEVGVGLGRETVGNDLEEGGIENVEDTLGIVAVSAVFLILLDQVSELKGGNAGLLYPLVGSIESQLNVVCGRGRCEEEFVEKLHEAGLGDGTLKDTDLGAADDGGKSLHLLKQVGVEGGAPSFDLLFFKNAKMSADHMTTLQG
jgi:hypothetical protein